ncbi:methylated-DNA--[protein]-cysteine S-methyltransferase [Nocardioides zeae]|uniref:Methylated-DNA--protein-cysteine methyltransferase n=1 Tax=Nocardioides zeae TaxID=1457234 RepID=A0A6P0HN41_9ACTN|nr:methylated-DNA--[protein]-cysteine S-methyltransferase [Nocardioides zeae]NEN80026.1 methylated-DNA--[protein]-cysteine S-methyltransferase [Nocardioides zeae]
MWSVIGSPIDDLRIVTDGEAVTAIDFAPHPEAPARPVGERADDHPVLVEAAAQLAAYFSGSLTRFDLPLAPGGSDFQRRVWAALAEIPFGATTSYGALARDLGLTGHGARAVGLANGRNPIPVVVPCHRVIGADGRLTGYAGGVERKQVLLDLERGDDGGLF